MESKSTAYQSMDECFEYSGEWWLPDQPAARFFGTLKYKPETKVFLQLSGGYDEFEAFRESWKHETVFGISESGEEITLRECHIGRFSTPRSSAGSTASAALEPSWVFIGGHFLSDEELRFDSVEIWYPYLTGWLTHPLRRPDRSINTDADTRNRNSEFPIIALDEIATMSIEYVPNFQKRPGSGMPDYAPSEAAYVHFKFAGGTSLEEIWRRYKRHWEHFFSLALGRPARALDIRGVLSDGGQKRIAIIEGIDHRADFYEMFPFVEMLFPFSEIKDHVDTYLKNWYSKMDCFEPVFNMYFAVLYQPDLYLDHKFLTYVIALETYHRIVTKNAPKFCKEEYNRLVEGMLASIPQEHEKYQKHFRSRLQFGNEPTLREKLRYLVDKMPKVSETFICHNDSGCKEFVHVVTETRNGLVHFAEWRSTKGIHTIGELAIIVKKLQLLMQICLLQEIGLSDRQICEFVGQTPVGRLLRGKSNN